MRPPTHVILVVNGIKVQRPVFVLGAPHSGADLIGRALKRSPGMHITMGRPDVARVVYAFARRPSIMRGQAGGPARVLRDVFAEAWRMVRARAPTAPPPAGRRAGSSGPRCAPPRRR